MEALDLKILLIEDTFPFHERLKLLLLSNRDRALHILYASCP